MMKKKNVFYACEKSREIFFLFFSLSIVKKKKIKKTTNTSEKKFTRRSPLGTRRRTRAL